MNKIGKGMVMPKDSDFSFKHSALRMYIMNQSAVRFRLRPKEKQKKQEINRKMGGCPLPFYSPRFVTKGNKVGGSVR